MGKGPLHKTCRARASALSALFAKATPVFGRRHVATDAVSTRTIEDGPRRLVLRERAGIVELVSSNIVLLSSAALETERAFGRLAASFLPPAGQPPRPLRVLVGGLGFGSTVRGVLEAVDDLATSAQGARQTHAVHVVVAEACPAVEALVHGELSGITGHVLRDSRVHVVGADVGDVIARADCEFDTILLDVDNGPHWASRRSNARLYSPAGLAAAMRALVEGGALAVWSGYPADEFLARLRECGFTPSRVPLIERGRMRARAYIGRRAVSFGRSLRDRGVGVAQKT